MNRNTLVGLTALVVIIIGAALYYGLSPTPAKAPVSTVTTTLTNPYTEHGAYYDISASYPTTASLGGGADESAVTLMQSWIIETVGQFKSDTHAEDPSPEDRAAMGFDQGRKVSLLITYRAFSSPHTVSYAFTTYQDTGGAHGNTFFTTFTFDARTGRQLALADLFAPSVGYLGKLSTIARTKLPGVLGDMANTQMIDNGTTPDTTNFESWYLDGTNLALLFPPYAVAPYAAGPQTLPISLADLADILRPEYR